MVSVQKVIQEVYGQIWCKIFNLLAKYSVNFFTSSGHDQPFFSICAYHCSVGVKDREIYATGRESPFGCFCLRVAPTRGSILLASSLLTTACCLFTVSALRTLATAYSRVKSGSNSNFSDRAASSNPTMKWSLTISSHNAPYSQYSTRA